MFCLPEGPIWIFVYVFLKKKELWTSDGNYEYSFLNVVYQELFFVILFHLFGKKYVENNNCFCFVFFFPLKLNILTV